MGVLQKCAVDDDVPPLPKSMRGSLTNIKSTNTVSTDANVHNIKDAANVIGTNIVEAQEFEFGKRFSRKWGSGHSPRIVCVRDYPAQLQFQALEHVNLSPRTMPGHFPGNAPIPSPRPSPKIHLSPRLAYMGLTNPRVNVSTAN
jgi:hypothetical protein